MTIAWSFLHPRAWSFIFGVYRLDSELTFCLGLVSIQMRWNGR